MNKLYSVHDHWTDIDKKNDVDIESIDGVITGIKVNGEDYGGSGESGFSTAKLTYQTVGQVAAPPIYISRIWDNAITSIIPVIGTYDVVLYNGVAYGILDSDNVSVNGAIEYDDGDLVITGDCTITIANIS